MAITDLSQCFNAEKYCNDPIFNSIDRYKTGVERAKNNIESNERYYDHNTLGIGSVMPIKNITKTFDEDVETVQKNAELLKKELRKAFWIKRRNDLTELYNYLDSQYKNYKSIMDANSNYIVKERIQITPTKSNVVERVNESMKQTYLDAAFRCSDLEKKKATVQNQMAVATNMMNSI